MCEREVRRLRQEVESERMNTQTCGRGKSLRKKQLFLAAGACE